MSGYERKRSLKKARPGQARPQVKKDVIPGSWLDHSCVTRTDRPLADGRFINEP